MKYNTVKLGDYLYIKGRIGWKGLKKSEYLSDGEYRIINGESLTKEGIDWNKAGYITQERYLESPEIMLEPNDILITKDGTIGKIGYVEEIEKPTTVASGIFVVRNIKPLKINTRFIYHFLTSSYFKRFIKMRTEGSVIPHLYQKDFVELDFPLPDITLQCKIVGILDAIEKKIRVNSEINDNLLQQASAIYQAWFEDYILYDGSLPSKWRQGTLADIANVTSGKRPPVKSAEKTDTAVIPLVGAASVMGYTTEANHTDKILVTGRVGTHGVIQRFNSPCWTSDNTLVITSNFYEYTYQILQRIDYSSMNRGSTQPLITQKDMNKVSILIPDQETLHDFETLVGQLMEQYQANILENNKLAEIRDALLPQLMSGELDVSDINI
ncbi:restriction endonuclease subunit S [Lachnospira multipara]|uniref:restriction endonuclease subunit S n=1 Tax=Lachnospira multipara TaxID=28051 RepID=UPI00048558AC|nr:restriction endonuclease subunit S [Lachnospira multipara]